jgi:hypothetical protein
MAVAFAVAAHAESWPAIDDLAADSALIVHCRAAKTAEGHALLAVVETWKGAYKPELFAPPPPKGFVHPGKADVSGASEFIIAYSAKNATAGKLTHPDFILPVADGKVIYPSATAGPRTAKTFTLAGFKAVLQSVVKFPLVNGDFEASPVGSLPDGWKAAYPNDNAVVATDGKDKFLRLSSKEVENAGVAQIVPVPKDAASIAVLGRMRGKPKNEKEEKRAAVEVAIRFQDAKGAMISAAIVASERSPAWRTFRREFAIPDRCRQVEVVARSIFAIGTFDFDTVRVEFK